MVGIIAGSVFVSVFSLVSSKALWNQRSYQARVIAKKETAVSTLQDNIESVNSLVTTYKEFTGTTENVLGGNPNGNGEKDGDNARITLDALPSVYDYPALTSSLEKVLTDKNMKIDSITGKDDEVAQTSKNNLTPKPIEMPFQFTTESSYSSLQDLISTLEKSIRPIHIQKLKITGNPSNLKTVVNGKTYYQPEKTLNIRTEVVK
jgi:hypothetical protein